MSAIKARIFLIHWNEPEARSLASPLRENGWEVEIESEDGARAGKRILADPPAAVVIYLRRLPSHGRETAHYLRSSPSGREIPIVFVDGQEEKVAKIRAKLPEAVYISSDQLVEILAGMIESA